MAHAPRDHIPLSVETGLPPTMGPACSPHLAPPDLLFFGYVTHSVQEMAFASHKEFHAAMHEALSALPKETLHGLFIDWVERLEWVPKGVVNIIHELNSGCYSWREFIFGREALRLSETPSISPCTPSSTQIFR
jgi:hypothetical protein